MANVAEQMRALDNYTQALNEELLRMKERTKDIKAQLRDLAERRARLCHINRLPPDILTKIFRCYKKRARTFNALNVLASVCKPWRRIALKDHYLWTRIREDHPDIVRTMLQRSGSLPVKMRGSVGDYESILAYGALFRVTRFDGTLTPQDVDKHFSTRGWQSAPHLRSFHVDGDGTAALDGMKLHAPKLRSITLNDAWLPTFKTPPTGLRRLKLRGEGFFITTFPELMDLLGGLPYLTYLHLVNAVDEDSINSVTKVEAVACPNLRSLFIHDGPSNVETLLRYILVGPSTTIGITIEPTCANYDDFSDVGYRLTAALLPWMKARAAVSSLPALFLKSPWSLVFSDELGGSKRCTCWCAGSYTLSVSIASPPGRSQHGSTSTRFGDWIRGFKELLPLARTSDLGIHADALSHMTIADIRLLLQWTNADALVFALVKLKHYPELITLDWAA
jgi:hypothetical protein